MKKAALCFLIFFAFLILCGCSAKVTEDISYAMGSAVTQKIYGGDENTASEALCAVNALDSLISYRNESSEVFRLNSGKTSDNEKIADLVGKSLALSEETDGVYDITVLPLVKIWGFDGDADDYRLPTEEEIKECTEKIGYGNIVMSDSSVKLDNGVKIDLSAVGKGEACEEAVNVYKSKNVTGAIVTVGGSVGVYGKKDDGSVFTVGVRDPFDKSALIGTLKLTDCFISTSGSYEKCFEAEDGTKYHHLLDAVTGYPAEKGLVSVTVVCGDGGESDSLASACFCVGMEKAVPLLEKHNAEAVFVTNDGRIYVTFGLESVFDAESFEVIK